ncbi:MAG: hypothetical protein P4M13_04280 [Alphaproteobacteria bacterium]|nr:hypothetical protein [Alphaproteobacteria bacterium]
MLISQSDKDIYFKAMAESYRALNLVRRLPKPSSDDAPAKPDIKDVALDFLYILKVGYYVFGDDQNLSARLRDYFNYEGVLFNSLLGRDPFFESRINLDLKSSNSVLDRREGNILSSFCQKHELEDGFLHNLITIKDSKSEGERKVSPGRPPQNNQLGDAPKAKTFEPIN